PRSRPNRLACGAGGLPLLASPNPYQTFIPAPGLIGVPARRVASPRPRSARVVKERGMRVAEILALAALTLLSVTPPVEAGPLTDPSVTDLQLATMVDQG